MMTPERWQELRNVLYDALQVAPADRPAFLDRACASDSALRQELESLLVGYGYKPYFVEGSDPALMHQKMAATLERAIEEIRGIQRTARHLL